LNPLDGNVDTTTMEKGLYGGGRSVTDDGVYIVVDDKEQWNMWVLENIVVLIESKKNV
jgi:hypothetical protein